jgi:integrase
MEVPATAHGFRSTFRDWAAERTNYPNEVSEMALAHAIDSKVEAAYRRGDMLERRRTMMTDWASFLAQPETPAKVLQLQRSRA